MQRIGELSSVEGVSTKNEDVCNTFYRNLLKFMDHGVRRIGRVETKNECSSLSFVSTSIAIVMPDPMDENRTQFLELPVEIQLEILRQLIGFQGDQAPIACTRLLKGIRL